MELCLVLVAALSFLASSPTDGATAKLPNSYPLCNKNDSDLKNCLLKAVQAVIPQLADGIPNLGVLPVDPMQVSSIEIGQGSGPVSVKLYFKNAIVHGLSKGIVSDVKPDLDNFKLDFAGKAEHLRLESDYEIDGKILVLPVTGKGRCNITFDNLLCRLGPRGSAIKKNGESYFDVTDFDIDITSLGKLSMQFENLFNGDKQLGETMNNLMNENWMDMWKELKPAFETTFGFIFKEYSSRIFGKVPVKEIFLE